MPPYPGFRRSTHAATRASRAAAALAALSLLAAAACVHGDSTGPGPVTPGDIPTATVDASKGWVYYSLDRQTRVNPANPAASTEWDIAFNASNVMLNGGHAGPGGVSGYCLCQNSAANPTPATILAYTAESQLPAFTAVTNTAVPPASSFIADDLTLAISDWHAGSGASATPIAGKAWLLRLRDGKGYAKLRVSAIQGPSIASPGRVTLEYATQPDGAPTLGTTRTIEVPVTSGEQARVDLSTGTVGNGTATAWDLAFDGWTIRMNSGVSGSGQAGATPATEPFDGITDVMEVTAPQAFKSDAFAGVFARHLWYRYDLAGDHGISPIFDIYLVRRGNQVYKLQITDYYGPAGESRQITFRYAPVGA